MSANIVFTPDGEGFVTATETVRGKTSYCVSGNGFEGWYPEQSVNFYQASDDVSEYEFGNIRDAAWKDVRDKAKRLKSEGAVNIFYFAKNEIQANVQGDNGVYDVEIHRKNASGEGVTWWDCSCPWGDHAWNRVSYLGRMCSHGLAAYYAMQGMSNRNLPSYAASVYEATADFETLAFIEWAENEDLELIFIDQIADALNTFNSSYGTAVDTEDVLEWIYDEKNAPADKGEFLTAATQDYTTADDFMNWLKSRSIIANDNEISAFDYRTIRGMVDNYNKSGNKTVTSDEVFQMLKRSHGYEPPNPMSDATKDFDGNLYVKKANAKLAGRELSAQEKQALIDEEGEASQLPLLNLNDTFYI